MPSDLCVVRPSTSSNDGSFFIFCCVLVSSIRCSMTFEANVVGVKLWCVAGFNIHPLMFYNEKWHLIMFFRVLSTNYDCVFITFGCSTCTSTSFPILFIPTIWRGILIPKSNCRPGETVTLHPGIPLQVCGRVSYRTANLRLQCHQGQLQRLCTLQLWWELSLRVGLLNPKLHVYTCTHRHGYSSNFFGTIRSCI